MRRSGLWALFALSFIIIGTLTLINIPAVQAERGNDWNAEFYNCKDLDCDEEYDIDYEDGINFDWDGKPEDDDGDELEDMEEDDFSVQFDTEEDFDEGLYEFIVTAKDGVRVYINGDLVLDEWDDRDDDETFEFTYNVGSDQELDLRVEFYNDEDEAVIQFEWFREGDATSDDTGTADTVATAGPSPTPIPPAQASVVRVNGLAIRTGPYLGATLVGVARPNVIYDVLAKNDSEGVYTWYLLTREGGITGWSSGRYLELTVDPSGIPSQSSIFDDIDGQPDRGVIGTPRAVMNFRVRPSTRVGTLGQIGWGEQVQIIGRTIRGGENYWLHVRRSDGTVGWIYAPFVTISGNSIDAVPSH